MRKALLGLFFVLILATAMSIDTTYTNTDTVLPADYTEESAYSCVEEKISTGEIMLYCSSRIGELEILVLEEARELYDCKLIVIGFEKEIKICRNEVGRLVHIRPPVLETTEKVVDESIYDSTITKSDEDTVNAIEIIKDIIEETPVESSEAIGVERCRKIIYPDGSSKVVCEREQEEILIKETAEARLITECEKIILVDGTVRTICKTREGELVQTREQTTLSEINKCEKYENDSGEIKVVCETNTGEIVSPKERARIDKISGCKKIVNSLGEIRIICNNFEQEIISPKDDINIVKVDMCKSILTDTGEKTVICETKDGEVMSARESKEDYEVFEDGIRIKIREMEKLFEPKEDDIDRLLKDLKRTQEELERFKKVAKEKEIKMKRRARVERIVKDESKIESKFTLDVENNTDKVFKDVTIVETIPKEIVASAYSIVSDYNFIILQDDPIIEFTIPFLLPNETVEVSYTVEGEADENVVDQMESPLASFGDEITLAECQISTLDADVFDLSFVIREDALADVVLEMSIPYSEACLSLQNVEFGNYSAFECPNAISSVQDAMFREMGFFTLEQGVCNASFDGAALFLDIRTSTDMIVTPLGAGNFEVTFRDWKFIESSAASTLTVKVPDGTKLTSFFPRSNPDGIADYELGIVFWSEIPLEKPSIKYQTPEVDWVLIGGGIVFFVLAVGIVGGLMFLKRKKDQKIMQVKFIKLKMQKLERKYMCGQMDETTYRRLMEQYQMQLTEIEVEISKKKM